MGESRLVKIPRVWNRPTVPRKDSGKVDHRISVCTDCRCGIFEDHDYEWTNRGLVHTACNVEVKREYETFTDARALP